MTLNQLCDNIELQKTIKDEVLRFAADYDFKRIEPLLEKWRQPEQWENVRIELEQRLAPDEKQTKMLTCMLICAAKEYETYQRLAIDDEIYTETMKCFTRFIEECREKTGVYAFDRAFWTVRQISLRLFRIGTLEYEMTDYEGKPAVSVHIPSDADLSPEAVKRSLTQAEQFFKTVFPEYKKKDYFCESWLLSPALEELLGADSKILAFSHLFEIIEVFPENTDYMEWVFQKKCCPVEELPENTTLQKRMKQYLDSGKKVGAAAGILRRI